MPFCDYLPTKKTPKKKKNVGSNVEKKPFISNIRPAQHTGAFAVKKKPSTPPKNTIPSSISLTSGVNMSEYSILHIDRTIRQKLSENISSIPELKKDLETSLWILNQGTNPVDKVLARKNVSVLRSRIRDLELSFELAMYSLRVDHLLEKYRKLCSQRTVQTFIKTQALPQDAINMRKKSDLVLRYISIAREYIDITNFSQKTARLTCRAQDCDSTDFRMEEDAIYVCNVCGSTLELLDESPNFKDTDRVNMCARYRYTRRGHFVEAMNRFQGKQNTTINENVYTTLRREIRLHNLTTSTVTKDQIYMFLSENKLSDHYEDINLIYYVLTNTSPPDISKYESELRDMFDVQDDAYSHVKDPERINSLNVNYKLYKLLQLVGYPCRKDDFYILKTRNKEEEHDEKWEELMNVLKEKYPNGKWRFIPTL